MKHPVYIAAELPKGGGETIRITLDEFKNRPVIDLRVWYQPAHGEPRPGGKGLTVAAWHLAGIKRGVDLAYAEAVKRGVIDPDHLAAAERANQSDGETA